MSRPLCSTCFREPVEAEGSRRCTGCGPKRIKYTNVTIDYPATDKTLADLMKEDK